MEELKDYIAVVILRDHLLFQDEVGKFIEAIEKRFNKTFKEEEVREQLVELELEQTKEYQYINEVQERPDDYTC